MAPRIKISCCYAHIDQTYLDQLKAHLAPLVRQGLIKTWDDTDITPGTYWDAEINKNLDTSEIILLLVSPDFIASEYCYSIEMQRVLGRHDRGETHVIPI